MPEGWGYLSREEWAELWGSGDSGPEESSYILPKIYPGPRVRCPNCGFWQGNEAVLDTYRWCMRCCTVLQDPQTLYHNEPLSTGPFQVVAASYGHLRDPRLAINVRHKLQARVDRTGAASLLLIRRTEDLTSWLGNPCPGEPKTLRIRYMFLKGIARNRRREVWLYEAYEGHLVEDLELRVISKPSLVIIFSAYYGAPGGASRGRGTFDVTEFMQGRVDLTEGSHLFVSKTEALTDLFGDPCPGRDKSLVLHYEVLGTEGRAEAQESDGRLLKPVDISCTPMIAPLLVIQSATYGHTQQGIDERLATIQRDLSDLLTLQHRKDMGMALSPDQNKRLMGLRSLIDEFEYLQGVKPKHFDVTAHVQRCVEEQGGGVLELTAAREDLNRRFGNPLPGDRKELSIRFLVVGHDSERLTSSEEATTGGYPRNFILQRKGRIVMQVNEDAAGRGVMAGDVFVDSPKVLPVIEILNSRYGHPRNSIKSFDISTTLRGIIDKQGGDRLQISTDDDLFKLFDDPCRGVRKKIKLAYIARGLNGRIRVDEHDRHLIADIIVGYYSRQHFRHDDHVVAEGHDDTSPSDSPHPGRNGGCGSVRREGKNVAAAASCPGRRRDCDGGNPGSDDHIERHDASGPHRAGSEKADGEEPNVDALEPALSPQLARWTTVVPPGHDRDISEQAAADERCSARRRSSDHRKKRIEMHQEAILRESDEEEGRRRRRLSAQGMRYREAERAMLSATIEAKEHGEHEHPKMLATTRAPPPSLRQLARTLNAKISAVVYLSRKILRISPEGRRSSHMSRDQYGCSKEKEDEHWEVNIRPPSSTPSLSLALLPSSASEINPPTKDHTNDGDHHRDGGLGAVPPERISCSSTESSTVGEAGTIHDDEVLRVAALGCYPGVNGDEDGNLAIAHRATHNDVAWRPVANGELQGSSYRQGALPRRHSSFETFLAEQAAVLTRARERRRRWTVQSARDGGHDVTEPDTTVIEPSWSLDLTNGGMVSAQSVSRSRMSESPELDESECETEGSDTDEHLRTDAPPAAEAKLRNEEYAQNRIKDPPHKQQKLRKNRSGSKVQAPSSVMTPRFMASAFPRVTDPSACDLATSQNRSGEPEHRERYTEWNRQRTKAPSTGSPMERDEGRPLATLPKTKVGKTHSTEGKQRNQNARMSKDFVGPNLRTLSSPDEAAASPRSNHSGKIVVGLKGYTPPDSRPFSAEALRTTQSSLVQDDAPEIRGQRKHTNQERFSGIAGPYRRAQTSRDTAWKAGDVNADRGHADKSPHPASQRKAGDRRQTSARGLSENSNST